ncbi:MAG: hypothetical protein ACI9U2_002056 [Bradymonadia bacterium]|jgi:hypothetical protein
MKTRGCLGLVGLLFLGLHLGGCLPEPASDGPVPIIDASTRDQSLDLGREADARSDAKPGDATFDAAPTVDAALPAIGCERCHVGVEAMHPWAPLTCVDCHGGDARGATQDAAHTPLIGGITGRIVRQLATDQLDALDREALQFINPGDLRVADRGCGAGNPEAAQGGCHQPIVERARRSVMQTYVGHYTLPRFLAGLQDRAGVYAAVDVTDPDFDPRIAGTVPRLTALRTPDAPMVEATAAAVLDRYLPQQCPWCHTGSFGRNDAPRNYRSSGCSACHVLYANDGLSRGADPTLDPTRPPHAMTHQLTSAIPTQQCERCHYQGARIGLSFQGIREGGFANQPPRAKPLGEPAHGHGPGFYLVDEDQAAPGDETPPDIHFERGMHCIDCHTSREVHGDGRLHSTAKGQLDVTCTDCHGTVRAAIEPGADGVFKTARNATPLRHLSRDANGATWLTGKVDGARHRLVQLVDLLAARPGNASLQAAMGVNDAGLSHTDTMECWTCHTAWRPSCFGCHVSLDDRALGRDHQSGLDVQGRATGGRNYQAIDFLALGINGRGKIDTLCPSMQILFEWIDETGETRMTNRVRETAAGQVGYGWMPTFAHTVRPAARSCTQCHPDDVDSNAARVAETYGFGDPSRGFFLNDDQGRAHDLTQARAADGAPLVAFPHVGSGLIPVARVARAMAVRISTGQERCNGEDDDGDGAVDEDFRFISDARHCGACDVACPEPAPICSLGRCLTRAWVSPDGDDIDNDGARDSPYRTLAHAIATLPGAARRILLLPGTHTLDAALDVPAQVEIEGAGLTRDDVILDGVLRFTDAPTRVDQARSAVRRLTLRRRIEVTRQALEVFDVVFAAPTGTPAVLRATDASVGLIQATIEGGRTPLIEARGGSVRVLRSRLIDNRAASALLVQRGGRVVVSNSALQANSGPIVDADEGARPIMTLNTIVETRAETLRLGPTAGRAIVANNIFAFQDGPAISSVAAEPVLFRNNLVWQSPASPIGQANPIAGDPAFVDRGAGDLHLGPDSAAIDRAEAAFSLDTDLEQRPRPQGPAPDLGAFER